MSDLAKMVAIAKKFGGSGGGGVQPDWNQTDETAADFIRNKPFGKVEKTILPEQTFTFDPANGATATLSNALSANMSVTVVWNGKKYVCEAIDIEGMFAFGNLSSWGFEDTGEPFMFAGIDANVQFMSIDGSESATVALKASVTERLDVEYVNAYTSIYVDIGDMTYIYADKELSHRVTREELMQVSFNSLIAIIPIMDGVSTANRLYPTQLLLANDYGYVSSMLGVHYTAEYTPET